MGRRLFRCSSLSFSLSSPRSSSSSAPSTALNSAHRAHTHALLPALCGSRLFLMSVSLAGLSLVSVQNPFTELASLLVGNGDIRSILGLLVFFIVSLVLAYLTNPSETSFRAYLTEQSFRHHLSRLDDSCDDASTKLSQSLSSIASLKRSHPHATHILPFDGSFPFHFANRASISLRTPKHVFHSFGLFTVAAMIPLPKSSLSHDHQGLMISDSWYIGAFGKWWRGGILETWYQDVISRSKDEESWSSGILSMKSLDILQGFSGSTAKPGLPHAFTNGSPPRLRKISKTLSVAPRSSTPPPLPKSSLLPLHTHRTMPPASEQRPVTLLSHNPPVQTQHQPCSTSESDAVSLSPSSSALFDQSPRIAQVLEQISVSKSSLADLHVQLQDCQTSTSQTHALLQEEVNSFRERKKADDSGKLEIKLRTKTLEESKRSAEAVKREADKKLKAVQSARDNASRRMQSLDREMAELQAQMMADGEILRNNNDQVCSTEQELLDDLERKKQEIKDTEDIIATFNQRARVLEDRLNDEREKIRTKKTILENRRSNLLQSSDMNMHSRLEHDSVTNLPPYHAHPTSSAHQAFDSHATSQSPYDFYAPKHSPTDMASSVSSMSITSPTGQSLIPSGLITSLDGPDSPAIVQSVQSDGMTYLDQDSSDKHESYQSLDHDSYNAHMSYDPFSMPLTISLSNTSVPSSSSKRSPLEEQTYFTAFENDQWPMSLQADSPVHVDAQHAEGDANIQQPARRWFTTLPKDKLKKGLNPDAKEFSLFKAPTTTAHHSLSSFDNLNPNGIGPSMLTSTSSTSDSLFLRAFAPSPAEREALQRALSVANTSFERLPSLSDVGSIPSSPSHVHAAAHPQTKKILPSWLPSLPRSRKSHFSPWGDEDPFSKVDGEKA